MTVLELAHWAGGVVILAEALNKLHRTDIFERGLPHRDRLLAFLKLCTWALLAAGGGGAFVTPLLPVEAPTLQDVCVVCGFAVLIIRTRIKEG